MNKKNLAPIIFCLVLTSTIFQISCSQTQIERFADNLKKAIEVFKEQRSETEEALRLAFRENRHIFAIRKNEVLY